MRKIPEALSPGEQSFVTWDGQGYLLMPDFREFTVLVNLHDPVRVRQLLEAFDYFWARSTSDPELRTLTL
jgi:hypothetical protein